MSLSFDTVDLECQYYSTETENQNSINLLENSFEEDQNVYMKKYGSFETELNKFNFIPNSPNSEIFQSEKDIEIIPSPKNMHKKDITPKNMLLPPEPNKEVKTKPLLGRKKTNSGEVGEHTKYAQDNMIRKFKPYFKDSLKDLVNSNIQKYIRFPNNMLNGIRYKKLEILNINQKQVKDISVEMNKELLQKKIKDFFSVEISHNYSNYPENFNELLIEEIYKNDNGEKVKCILEKTILESLKYFRMDEDVYFDPNYSCLKGLEKSFIDFKKELLEKNNEKYANGMVELIKNFEVIYFNKRSRAKRIKKGL